MHFGETPQARVIREANEAEQRRLAALAPVTWTHVLWWAFFAAVLIAMPLTMQHHPKWARWSPWLDISCFLSAVCVACAAIASWRGVRKGWTEEQTTTAGFTLGCWVFGVPIALALVIWAWTAVSGALAGTPWWAAVIIVLLIALLLKK